MAERGAPSDRPPKAMHRFPVAARPATIADPESGGDLHEVWLCEAGPDPTLRDIHAPASSTEDRAPDRAGRAPEPTDTAADDRHRVRQRTGPWSPR